MPLIGQDIVIVDTQTDLNVYVDMTNERKEENRDAADCCDPSAIGSASRTAQESPYCSEKVANCCSRNSTKASDSEHAGSISTAENAEISCCSELRSKTQSGVAASWNFADIDINEWTGRFLCSRATLYSHS